MAGAKPGVHVVQLKQISVPQALIDGEKFIKWDEDSQVGTPVTLKVDKNGYFLYWTDQNNERDFLDICSIRDTRTGKYARIPKDSKLRDTVSAGASEPLENKTLTVVHGSDFVNVNFVNFCSTKSNSAKIWCDSLLEMAYNLLAINASVETFLRKAHIKVTLLTDRSGNIPIKNVVKLFAQHKDDKKRVEKALYAAGLPSTKNEYMDPSKFTWEVFLVFYKNLTGRNELTKIYESLICDNSIVRKKQPHLGIDDLVEFLNNHQRDPRLNEILYPYANANRAREIILQYEPNASLAQKGYLSEEGFLKYILSQDNAITSADKLDLSDDMTQPLCHYFINSSHNTYLTGHQFTGRSSVEIYRQCLLSGCRCVELDFWNGRTEEPVIVHGYTLVPEILAKDAIEAIADSAFKTSDYPVVLSFENHCNPKQQAKIAQYCHEYFGDMLLDKPLDMFNLEPGVPLPSPQSLCRKIIIKNKKKHFHRNHKKSQSNTNSSSSADIPSPPEMQGNGDVPRTRLERDPSLESPEAEVLPNGELEDTEEVSASESEEETESLSPEEIQAREKAQKDKGTAGKESEAGAELSALVNYVQPVHFHSFELAEKRNRSYEMSSFVETQATALLKEHPIEFVNYNKRQLSRVYPRGTRVDSSNFMPQVFWNAGCQLVALNYQTLDLAMQLNLGIFEFNKRSGYLLKPDFMRRPDRRFDPFAESTVDGIIAGTVSVQVISGQFLSDKRVSTFVEVEMYGLPADTVRKKFRTKTVSNNGINPVYEEEPFVFKKVVLPDLTCIRMIVYEESGRLLGHRVLPVTGLRPGYRHISLRNEANQPLTLATLFVRITVKDYVPDGLSDFAEALANPIKYQSDLEKRSQQLSVLTDDDSEDDKLAPNDAVTPSSSTHQFVRTGSVIGQSPTTASRGPSSPAAAAKTPGLDSQMCSVDDDADSSKQSSGSVLQSTETPIGTRRQNSTKLLHSVKTASSEEAEDTCLLFDTACNVLTTDSVEKVMEHKLVKEKKAELDKKLESLKKKHLKEKNKLQQDQIKTHSKLVKKLSSKKGDKMKLDRCSIDEPEGQRLAELQRSHSEVLLSLESTHYNEERDLQLKFIEPIFAAAEKAMKLIQATQLKTLQTMHEKEKDKIKKKIAAQNLKEVKALSQKHKDKDELDRYGTTSRKQIYEVYLRVKREVNFTIVQKGVVEIETLKKIYERRQEEIIKEHEEIRKQLEEEKRTRKRDWEEKRAKSTELPQVSCSSPETAISSL